MQPFCKYPSSVPENVKIKNTCLLIEPPENSWKAVLTRDLVIDRTNKKLKP